MNAPAMSHVALTTFRAAGTPLPLRWSPPPDAAQFDRATAEHGDPSSPNPAPLFVPATANRYHRDAANTIGARFEAYIDGTVAAIGEAVDAWRAAAAFAGVQVQAASAIGAPGCLQGPSLTPLLLRGAPQRTPSEQRYSRAVANALGEAWGQWQAGVSIPGLALFPAFALMPSPVAPPAPCVPFPLASLPSAGLAALEPAALAAAMQRHLADPAALHQDVLFRALATGVRTAFDAWRASQMLVNLVGSGPVPQVPGPVVGGTAFSAPGAALSAGPASDAALVRARLAAAPPRG